MKHTVVNIILLVSLAALLGGAGYCGYRLQQLSAERVAVKEDYSLSNSVTFGLFSVDQWRDRISEVIGGEIDDYHITKKQRKDLQIAVEKQLHTLVGETVAEINKPQKSFLGKLKKLAFNALVDSGEIQAQVRPFAKTIVTKVSSPESEARLKSIASSKFHQLEKQIYDSTSVANYAVTKYVYKKYKVADPVAFNNRITENLKSLQTEITRYIYYMLGCVVVALLLWFALRKQVHLQTPLFVFALLFALLLLIMGSVLPVIEVDARIQSLDLLMMGNKVNFQNQVLFYQSKSLLGIVTTLISQQKPDAILVGSLIMLFVLVLPLVRIISKGIYILSPKTIAAHPVMRYLTFEMGKWDMADVMIVGMLMTYIGLNGILKSQLSALNIHTPSLQVVTSNDSTLQAGYFIFVGYVFFGILLSYILKKLNPHDELK